MRRPRARSTQARRSGAAPLTQAEVRPSRRKMVLPGARQAARAHSTPGGSTTARSGWAIATRRPALPTLARERQPPEARSRTAPLRAVRAVRLEVRAARVLPGARTAAPEAKTKRGAAHPTRARGRQTQPMREALPARAAARELQA